MTDDDNSDDKQISLKAATNVAMEVFKADQGDSEQMDLLPPGDGGTPEPEFKRGPGRPAGSKNKSTEEWSRYLLTRFRSPLEALAEIQEADTVALARQLGCEPLEALRLRLAAARELAPYIHSKQPVALQLDARGEVALHLTVSPAMAGEVEAGVVAGDGAMVVEGEIVDPGSDSDRETENQAITDS